MIKQEIRPMFSTTVDPSEYDIHEQMERMAKLSNKNRECFTLMDVGKTWGLYLAWKRLSEDSKELLEYLQHDSWRCGYHQKCHCGLDLLTDKLGIERVPLPNKT